MASRQQLLVESLCTLVVPQNLAGHEPNTSYFFNWLCSLEDPIPINFNCKYVYYSLRWILECESEILVHKYFFNGFNKITILHFLLITMASDYFYFYTNCILRMIFSSILKGSMEMTLLL